MVTLFVSDMKGGLSTNRLERYRPAGRDDLAMVVTYLWNVRLCEALYHSLGSLEVALRNSIHDALTAHFGRSDWYDQPALLQKRQTDAVGKAKQNIRAAGKAVIPGRIVAGLSFGFWTSLLSQGYGSLWSQNNHALIKQAFARAPVQMQYRSRAHGHFNMIRLLRNRVFHYESIYDDPDLLSKQAGIIDALAWINPTLQAATIHFDHFSDVHQNGLVSIETEIKRYLGVI